MPGVKCGTISAVVGANLLVIFSPRHKKYYTSSSRNANASNSSSSTIQRCTGRLGFGRYETVGTQSVETSDVHEQGVVQGRPCLRENMAHISS